MCAIMSPDNKLHVYVDQDVLAEFSESVKCFDQHYALELTLLYPRAQQEPPPRPGELRCADGFRALKGGLARNGRLQNQEGVQVVRFTGNTDVAERAFEFNNSLMELCDVNTIEDIHFGAFRNCSALAQLEDLSALKTIGASAFRGTQLTQLGDMAALTEIGNDAFEGTPLTQLGNLSSLTTIGDFAFFKTPLEKLVTIPLLTTIGYRAFEGCEQLEIVHLPRALKFVEKDAFLNCPLGHLTVEPGINFECRCANLTNMLRRTQQPIQVRVRDNDDDCFDIRAEYD